MTVKEQVFNKYLGIKYDVISNLQEVFNRKNYYTKKHRGNRFTDVNVGIDYGPKGEKIIRIFVRYEDSWIKDTIKFKRDKDAPTGVYFESKILSNLFDNE